MLTTITNIGSNSTTASIAKAAGWEIGAKLPCACPGQIYFADQNWKAYNHEKYLAALQKWQPRMATLKDYEHPAELEGLLETAYVVSKFIERIVIIPKIDDIASIPHWVGDAEIILGYSVPTRYGKTDVPIRSFTGRKVHLLGGSLKSIVGLLKSELNVVSLDYNAHLQRAKFGWAYGGKDNLNFEYLGRDVSYLTAYSVSSYWVRWCFDLAHRENSSNAICTTWQ